MRPLVALLALVELAAVRGVPPARSHLVSPVPDALHRPRSSPPLLRALPALGVGDGREELLPLVVPARAQGVLPGSLGHGRGAAGDDRVVLVLRRSDGSGIGMMFGTNGKEDYLASIFCIYSCCNSSNETAIYMTFKSHRQSKNLAIPQVELFLPGIVALIGDHPWLPSGAGPPCGVNQRPHVANAAALEGLRA